MRQDGSSQAAAPLTIDVQRDFALPSSPAHIPGNAGGRGRDRNARPRIPLEGLPIVHRGIVLPDRLEELLRTLDVDSVVICRCNFLNCPRTTISEVSERDLEIVFVSNATSGV